MKFCLKSDTFLPVLILNLIIRPTRKACVFTTSMAKSSKNLSTMLLSQQWTSKQDAELPQLHSARHQTETPAQMITKCQSIRLSIKQAASIRFTNTEKFLQESCPFENYKNKKHLSALILQCLQVYWTWCPVHRIVVDSARFFGAFHGMRSNLTGLNSVRFQLLHFIPTDWSSYGQLYRKPEKKTPPFCQCAQQATL